MAKLSKQVSLGYDPVTGKRVRRWIHADSKPALKQAEKDVIAEYARSGVSSTITLGKYREKWFQAYCAQLQASTKYVYERTLTHLKELDHKRMDKITRTDIQQIISDLWDKPYAARKLVSLMAQIWRSAVLDGVVSKNIVQELKLPKKPKSGRRALTEKEIEAVKNIELPEQERFLVDVLFQFGLRPQEAFALSPKSFDRKAKTLTIDKAVGYNKQEPYIKETKTGATRVLPVPDSFWEKIPTGYPFFFFVREDGSLWHRQQTLAAMQMIRTAVNYYLGGNEKIKKTDMTLYTFRHNKATQLYYLPGVTLKKKAEYMGHSELMFIRTYSHLDNTLEETEALRQAM